jgi:DNA polymerase III epsilon subunit family exonuclease
MFALKSKGEFIQGLKALDERLKDIRLSSIEIDKEVGDIKYNFIINVAIDQELKAKILEEARRITLPAFKSVSVSVKKIATNDSLVNCSIIKFLKENYPSISIFLKDSDARSVIIGDVCKYVLRLTQDGIEYVNKNGVLNRLNEFLEKNYCSQFVGALEEKEADEEIDLSEPEVFEDQIKKIEHRTIKVPAVEIIDDIAMGNLAVYIEDAVSGDATICGKITDIREKETKTGKPFFIFHIDDTTGTASGVYFTKKNTYERIKRLQVGDAIICRVNVGEYQGKPSITFNKINGCEFPSDFVKKEKFKKTAPREYSLIFPNPATVVKAQNVFDEVVELPKELTEKEYVVFDLETTGFDVLNNGITEVGAVKIKDGKIVEEFTSLIKPDYPISEEITEVTGIDYEMVKDSPKIGAVIPDFMKFIEGATLVAHNAEFDIKFIKRFAGIEEYEIRNEVVDTVLLARKYLPFLKHVDLHTVADHFGIIFRHHRALSDAYATAESFIELMKIKAQKEKA